MRLLDTKTLKFRDFYQADIPLYAILSHTWGDGDVTFQKMSWRNRELKKGFAKIKKTCDLAREDGLDYAWVDTCCIDKSSSAELTEAINSMYQWYSEAALCYVYLEDLPLDGPIEEALPSCKWFTRGWTLQELLAPKDAGDVQFYDMEWNYRGSKQEFCSTISTCTGIREDVLRREVAPADCSVAERMSWAARRKTTRIEDTAYCLLGIFDVNMPLLYGEGRKSFRRLQEEIVKRNNDLTILAWEDSKSSDKTSIKLFADSPAAFINSALLSPFGDDFPDFSVTNKGLLVSEAIELRVMSVTINKYGNEMLLYALFLGTSDVNSDLPFGIYLRKIGPKLFTRDWTLPLAGFGLNEVHIIRRLDNVTDYYILTEPKVNISEMMFREGALHVPSDDTFQIKDTVPETLWDVTNCVFLKPKPYASMRYPMVIAITFNGKLSGKDVRLVVLCDYQEWVKDLPICRVFWEGDYPHEEAMIFQERNKTEGIYWSQLEIDAPHILQLGNSVEKKVGSRVHNIAVGFEKGMVPSISEKVELFSLKFNITNGITAAHREKKDKKR